MKYLNVILAVLLVCGSFITTNLFGANRLTSDEKQPIISANSDIDTVRQRVYNQFILNISDKDIRATTNYLASQNSNGSWSDLDYTDKGGTLWSPSNHLSRILSFTHAYLHKGQIYYKDPVLLKHIVAGLEFWYNVNPTAPENTWWNYIGKYTSLCPIAILLQGILPDNLMNKVIDDFPSAMPKAFSTGANRADQDNIIIIKGLLRHSETLVKSGISDIAKVIPITTDEGIQRDFSFHQHGPFLYNVGYGSVFLGNLVYWMYMCRNTAYSFTPSDIATVSDMLLEGNRWMTRGTVENYSATGRGISREATADALGLTEIMNRLSKVADPVRSAKLVEMRANILVNKNQNILGNKHFWRSDFTAHHRPKYYTSVAMCSDSTTGAECMNGECIKGYWLGFGCNYLFRHGYEYKGIFPVWDWTHIPGVTNPAVIPVPSGFYVSQHETFVGGVSDGLYGVTAMKMNIQSTQARKSWFYFDKEYVALGSGISSTNENAVSTTINQTFRKPDASIENIQLMDTSITTENTKYVMNDSTAYIFPHKSDITVSCTRQTGSWYSINTSQSTKELTHTVFNLYINHGVKPVNETYSYIVLPGVNQLDVRNYLRKQTVFILRNDSNVQAVCNKPLKKTGLVFYRAGKFTISRTLKVTISSPCMILLDESTHLPLIHLASPNSSSENISVKICRGKTLFEATFLIPSGDMKGSTVSQILQKKE